MPARPVKRAVRRARHTLAALLRWDRRAGAQSRLLLALKSAIAAGAAWLVALAVPGAASHYPYYAPLGAVIATGSTVLGGVRDGVRTIVGLAVGIGLALLVVAVGGPHYLSVPIAVGVAVLASGFRFVGAANTWVASAAVFVLLIGGTDPTDYSIGYLVQTLIGAAVGVAVNMLLLPPLAIRDAEGELAALRGRLADHLERLGDALEEDDVDGRSWAERLDQLQADTAQARRAVGRADESRRGNPRVVGRDVRSAVDAHYRRLRSLERATFALTDVTDILGTASPVTEPLGRVDAELTPAFVAALHGVAEAIRADPSSGDEREDALREAQQALAALQQRLDKEGHAHPSEMPLSTAAVVALRNAFLAATGAGTGTSGQA